MQDVIEAAKEYIDKGWYPIPVPQGEKGPNLKGWTNLRLNEENVPEYFSKDQNIGIILGEPSGGLTDVDLDCVEARKLAFQLLPFTKMKHGRDGNPRSHYWYICSPPQRTVRFHDPTDKDKTILEIRGTGGQTVVPPSIHPSGEEIEWVNFGEPTQVSYDELHTACSKLAALALLARYWPKEGSGIRQDTALALSGALLRAGWNPDKVEKMIKVIADLAGDEEADSRVNVVKYTEGRLATNQTVYGWNKLGEFIDRRVVKKAQEWLGVSREGEDLSHLLQGFSPETPSSELTSRLEELVPILSSKGDIEQAEVYADLKNRIPKEFLEALKKEVKKAKKVKIDKGTSNLEDLEEFSPLHSSLDFTEDTMALGFRVESKNGEDLLLILSDGQNVRCSFNDQEIDIENKKYTISKDSTPPFLRDRWNFERLRTFLSNPLPPENLFGELVKAFKKYLDLPDEAYKLLAAWTVGTYFSHVFSAYPFINSFGPKETGKSKVLTVLQSVCFNADKSRDITAAALGDIVEGKRGTVLIDQAESLDKNLIGLLADSYKKSGGKRRVIDTSNNKRNPREFSTYGPKAFATTKDLDPDLRDRCIRLRMVRTSKPLPDMEGYEPEWGELRDALYRFSLLNFKEVRKHYLENQETGNRVKELWKPLEAVLKALHLEEEEIAQIKEFFMESVSETRHELDDWESCLFNVLAALLIKRQVGHPEMVTLSCEEISTEMTLELGLSDEDRHPSPRWVGERIKKFSLNSGNPRRGTRRGRKVTEYQFSPGHVFHLKRVYLREN